MRASAKPLLLLLGLMTLPLIASAQSYADDELLGGPISAPAVTTIIEEIIVIEEAPTDIYAVAPGTSEYETVIYVDAVTPPNAQQYTSTETTPPPPGERRLSWQSRDTP